MRHRLCRLVLVLALAAPAARADDATPPSLEPILHPPPADEIGRGPAPVYTAPATAKPSPAPSNAGPVTGYGAGGMQTPPGSPPNPPYLAAPYTTAPTPR